QIFDYQQNPHEHGDVRVHKDKIYDAIGMYCMWLQFELVTRTKSLDIVVSPPTLYGIFDEKRGFKIEISPSQSLNFPEGIKNLSPNAFSGIKDLIGEGRALNSLGDDATMH
ncbi:MAG: hypothetical protein GY718_09865, partial [Lentisphaerae bacterium]|nr:hypothetical protein [Lentisphaerota bacterium]